MALADDQLRRVALICLHLDGIPLAVELAAARIKVLSPNQILRRLSDRFGLLKDGARTVQAKHRTLQAAIDWSYDLLEESEKLLLCRLGVFTGGCTLEACGDDESPALARLYFGAARIMTAHFDSPLTVQCARRSLELSRRLHDRSGTAWALAILGIGTAKVLGDVENGKAQRRRSAAQFREIGDSWGLAGSLAMLGYVVTRSGDARRAIPLLEEGLVLSRQVGDRVNIGCLLHGSMRCIAAYR